MDTHDQNFRFKKAFLVAVAVLFTQNLSYTVSGVYGDQNLELMVGTSDHGICGFGKTEDNADDAWVMVEKKGNQFVVNEKQFYVNGFNTYWLMVFGADQSTRGKVSEFVVLGLSTMANGELFKFHPLSMMKMFLRPWIL
ncbi:hypothetical protein CsSME_00017729 [Camellia sinensis var. sinensis]